MNRLSRRRPLLRFLLVACTTLAFARAADVRSERGLPLVQPFPVTDYQAHNQAWAMTQDRAGVLYVGNRDCVLTYDGLRWVASRPAGSSSIRSASTPTTASGSAG